MLLKASKSQHLYFDGSPPTPLLIPNENETFIPLSLVSSANYLGIVVDSFLKPTIKATRWLSF